MGVIGRGREGGGWKSQDRRGRARKKRRDKTAKQAAEFISHNLSLDGGAKALFPTRNMHYGNKYQHIYTVAVTQHSFMSTAAS